MHIYGVFREDDSTPYGTLCGRGNIDSPALYGNEEAAIERADFLKSLYAQNIYSVHKFNLNPNGFMSERIY